MDAEIAFRTAVSLVPNWYLAACGPHQYTLSIGGKDLPFYSHRRMTPDLDSFYCSLRANLAALSQLPGSNVPGYSDLLQQLYALKWLCAQCAGVNWERLLGYLHTLSKRTYENQPVAVNLVVRKGEGHGDLTQPAYQKFLDQLAASPFTYFVVDGDVRLIGYEQIRWSEIKDSTSYTFHPEFLHPFHCILADTESLCSIHLTASGDLIVMNRSGLLAAKRKGQWKVYDVQTFKNLVVDCMKDYAVGANLFELLFDLSFKRHGALLIYDPDHSVVRQIVNSESIVFPEDGVVPGSGQAVVAEAVRNIALGVGVSKRVAKKRVLMELASVDGAVIFDNDHIMAVGAVVKSHEKVGSHLGARTTAALSARYWGGLPAKVSSDGQITLYFDSTDGQQTCLASIEFL